METIFWRFSAYETFVWGSNKNYNLGIADEEHKNYPQQLDYFKKESIFLHRLARITLCFWIIREKFMLLEVANTVN